MKLVSLTAVLAAVVSVSALGASQAFATTPSDCQAQLSQLRADTVAAEDSFTNPKDFTGAVAKLDAAAVKLDEGKNADATQKLVDFQSLLNKLATAAKPKLDPAVAQQLVAEAQGVIDCIAAIGTA